MQLDAGLIEMDETAYHHEVEFTVCSADRLKDKCDSTELAGSDSSYRRGKSIKQTVTKK